MDVNTYVVTGVGRENSLGSLICREVKAADEKAYIIAICEPGVAPDMPQTVDQFFNCDLSDRESTIKLFTAIGDHNREVDRLINCAGTNYMDWFSNVDFDTLERVMAVNCYAPIWATQALRHALSSARGTVLNIVSMGAHKPFRTSLAYNISKAALAMATKQLAREIFTTDEITVFGISPNELEGTGMTLENEVEIMRVRGWTAERVAAQRTQGSQTNPNTLAEFIAFLLASDSRHKHFNGVDLYYGD